MLTLGFSLGTGRAQCAAAILSSRQRGRKWIIAVKYTRGDSSCERYGRARQASRSGVAARPSVLQPGIDGLRDRRHERGAFIAVVNSLHQDHQHKWALAEHDRCIVMDARDLARFVRDYGSGRQAG